MIRQSQCIGMVVVMLLDVSVVHAQLTKLWEVKDTYKAPESVAYDSKRGCLYISNYTERMKSGSTYGAHFISKANMQGRVLDLEWLGQVTSPLGICIANDKLYIAERFGVVIYDLAADKVANRIYIKTSGFLNDITVDDQGRIYVSESDTNVIHRIQGNQVETWLDSEAISRPNGVLADNDKLIVAVNGDNYVKAVDIASKEVTNIAHVGPGILDGIKKCSAGYLVSLFEGNLFLVKPSGEVTELLNTRENNINVADFEYIEDKQLIVIPALWNNLLLGYQYNAQSQ